MKKLLILSMVFITVLCGCLKNPDAGNKELFRAAAFGTIGIAERGIKIGGDVNTVDSGNSTPLDTAILNGHSEMVQFLVDNGAYVNSADPDSYGPLVYVAMNGTLEMAKTLVEAGADVNALTPRRIEARLADGRKTKFPENITAARVAVIAGKRDVSNYLFKVAKELKSEE